MFNKKKKDNLNYNEEIIVATSKSENVIGVIKQGEDKVIQDFEIVGDPLRENDDYKVGNFTFYDSDPQSECSVDNIENEGIDKSEISKSKRKELLSFFEESKDYNRKIIEKKVVEKDKNNESELKGVSNEDFYVFRNVKYAEVEDFIEYLDSNYLDIENISKEALNDEKYYEWLSRKSNVFDESIKLFKEIKEKIEKK